MAKNTALKSTQISQPWVICDCNSQHPWWCV